MRVMLYMQGRLFSGLALVLGKTVVENHGDYFVLNYSNANYCMQLGRSESKQVSVNYIY